MSVKLLEAGEMESSSQIPLLQMKNKGSVLDVQDIENFKKDQKLLMSPRHKNKSSQAKYTKIENPVWYLSKILFVYFLVFVDMFLNSSVNSDNYGNIAENSFWPFLFLVVQSSVQVFIFLTLFLLMCGTYLMKIGLPGVIVSEFKFLGIAQGVYLLLSMVLGIMRIYEFQKDSSDLDPRRLWKAQGFTLIFTLQNLAAAVYYHQVLHSSFKLSHEKYYSRTNWRKLSSTI